MARLNRAALSGLASPRLLQRFDALGITPRGMAPRDFRSLIAQEHARWGAMIHDADIRMN